jgi:hypothetical protein
MTDLASFSALTGVGPVTEARLHEAGVHSWSQLAAVLEAFDGIRANGRDPLRRLFRQAAERAVTSDTPVGGERSEGFVVRVALDGTRRALRTRATHARTGAEQVWSGWAPIELACFLEDCAGMPRAPCDGPGDEPTDADESVGNTVDETEDCGTSEHVVQVDAGRLLGGRPHDIDLLLDVRAAEPGQVRIVAHLVGRTYGQERADAEREQHGWSALGRWEGDVDGRAPVPLHFGGVSLPPGLHRLRLSVTVHLAAPVRVPPEITLR